MVAKACVFDSFLVAAIVAWRRRRQIAGWINRLRPADPAMTSRSREAGPELPAE
jgi:hypothetical protein